MVRSTAIDAHRSTAGLRRRDCHVLSIIYTGNVREEKSDTAFPLCGEILIRRGAMSLRESKLKGPQCPSCEAREASAFS
jgi:hypothetical protein